MGEPTASLCQPLGVMGCYQPHPLSAACPSVPAARDQLCKGYKPKKTESLLCRGGHHILLAKVLLLCKTISSLEEDGQNTSCLRAAWQPEGCR